MVNKIPAADVNRPETWVKFRPALCVSCSAGCCTLPVEVKLTDLVRMHLIDAFEMEEPAAAITKRLRRAGVIERFNSKSGLFTLARRADGSCLYLDPRTRRCTIYAERPDTCRNHPRIGPRPGYCAYAPK